MNVYNEAHNLAKAVKESHEFKEYDAVKKQIADKPELMAMLQDFQMKQLEMQAKQMMGEAPAEDMMAQVQELYSIMMRDPLTAQYLQCEIRFSMMMNDVYKILAEAVGMGIPGIEGNE